jgi:hypothetical protein
MSKKNLKEKEENKSLNDYINASKEKEIIDGFDEFLESLEELITSKKVKETIKIPTKVTIEHHDMKVISEFPNSELGLFKLFELFKQSAIGVGFQIESWEKVIVELANEITER